MTMAEFQLRAYGYRRAQQNDWAKFRKVAFCALWAFNSDGKKLPKKEEQLLSLPMVDPPKETASPEMVEAFIEEVRKYNEIKASRKK